MKMMNVLVRRAVAAVATASLVMAGLPAAALAAAGDVPTTGTVDCGNGWILSYTASDGEAQITGVATAPSAATGLTIPSKAGSATVTSVGKRAFYECKALSTVSLPSTMEIIGEEAFRTSSITSITFPTSLKGVDACAFSYCTSLSKVAFQAGSMPEYLGEMAFAYDSSLKELTVPPLSGRTYLGTGWSESRIGKWCFKNCTSLEKVVFEAGSTTGATEYFISSTAPFDSTKKDLVVIFYAKRGVGSRDFQTYGTSIHVYNAVNYYQSKEDYLNDPLGVRPWKQVLVSAEALLTNLAKGKIDGYGYNSTDVLPSVPAEAASQGLVWGIDTVQEAAVTSNTNTAVNIHTAAVNDVMSLYPVDPGDMNYNFVTSSAIENYVGNSTLNAIHKNSEYQRLRADGTVDLSNLKVITCGGSVVKSDSYTYVYRLVTTVGSTTNRETYYTPLASEAEVNKEGDYQVKAVGVGAYAGTETAWTDFHVKRYDAPITSYASGNQSADTGDAIHDAINYLEDEAHFIVYAPDSSWQACLVATSMAGVGNGLAAYLDAGSSSNEPFQVLSGSGLGTANFVGSKAELGSANISRVKDILGADGTVNYFDYADPCELAVQVYQTVAKYGPRDDEPYDWGDTAILCSSTSCSSTAAIAQYAYQLKAPVFFTSADGSLDSATKEAIAGGEFSRIIIAGGEQLVSQAVCDELASIAGVELTRVLDSGSTIAQTTLDNIADVQALLCDESGTPVNSALSINIASASDPTNTYALAQLAALEGGVVLTCASSAEARTITQYLLGHEPDYLNSIRLVGDFSLIDPDIETRMKTLWTASSAGTVGVGDTVAVDGIVYRLDSTSAATLMTSLEPISGELVVGGFSYAGSEYTVKGIAANAFAGSSLTGVSMPTVTKIGSSAFKGCTSLTKVTSKATSIGASAFQGCTALKTVTLSGAITSLPSSCFAGCSKLATVTLSSAKLKTIAASAFNGCKKLGTLTIKSSKLSKVGSKAMTGTPTSLKVKCPKAKVSAYKKLLQSTGMSKKAKVSKM